MLRKGLFVVLLVAVLGAGAVLASAALDRPARYYRDAVVVEAPRAAIWALLTEFDRYEEWNPYITEGRGSATPDSTLELGFRAGDSFERQSAKVLIVRPMRKLEWETRTLVPGLLDREQIFRVLPMNRSDRWLVVQEVRLEGLLAPVSDFDADRAGLVAMLAAIRELAPDYQSSPA